MKNTMTFSERFRGYMPVVIDVETGGFNHTTDALLEIAAVFIKLDKVISCQEIQYIII